MCLGIGNIYFATVSYTHLFNSTHLFAFSLCRVNIVSVRMSDIVNIIKLRIILSVKSLQQQNLTV